MKLSKRLRAVADLVTEGASVADVGTDHGYIPIYLVEKGIAEKVIAMDVNEGPLERARIHIRQNSRVRERVETRCSDGLHALEKGEVDTVIAAGMGGGLILKILMENRQIAESLSHMILQPQSEIAKVRAYLTEQGFSICQEDMVREDGKYYTMIDAVPGEEEEYASFELQYGRRLLEKKHPTLKEYLFKEQRIKEEIAVKLVLSGSSQAKEREREIQEELRMIRQAIDCF